MQPVFLRCHLNQDGKGIRCHGSSILMNDSSDETPPEIRSSNLASLGTIYDELDKGNPL